jgi:hypothetical protein
VTSGAAEQPRLPAPGRGADEDVRHTILWQVARSSQFRSYWDEGLFYRCLMVRRECERKNTRSREGVEQGSAEGHRARSE